ncbi:hypothetical protein SFC23_00515 [Shouchella clausii]|uniref:hypothetical protein n=1 Tax=Shouchella clausii TaxID=79880 RepID=UPI000BA73196|nr:hypothetical protein [Shouchella clausii]PAD94028.1 hypothetical protein CHH52_01290 [Shouchella clausii]
MNGILKVVGEVLIELQENGEAVIKDTDELYAAEEISAIEAVLKETKGAYKVETADREAKIVLQ